MNLSTDGDEGDYASEARLLSSRLDVLHTSKMMPVAGHISVAYRGCLITWGGYYQSNSDKMPEYRPLDQLCIYPFALAQRSHIWVKVHCPREKESNSLVRPLYLSNSGAAAALHKDLMYIFGGCVHAEADPRWHFTVSDLMIFNLITSTFSFKRIEGRRPSPRDKCVCWMDGSRFFVFGGYGTSPPWLEHRDNYFVQPDSSFLDDHTAHYSRHAWNNQLLYIDNDLHHPNPNNEWVQVQQGGSVPSPRAATAAVFVKGLGRAFLFGGRCGGERLNDLYELDTTTFIWTQINLRHGPSARSWATFTSLPDHHKIVLYGGLSGNKSSDPPTEPDTDTGVALNDLWELDLHSYYYHHDGSRRGKSPRPAWTLISRLEHRLPPRLWHTATLIERTSYGDASRHSTALLYYGGMSQNPNQKPAISFSQLQTLLFRRVEPPSLLSLSMRVMIREGRGTASMMDILPSPTSKYMRALTSILPVVTTKQQLLGGEDSPTPPRKRIRSGVEGEGEGQGTRRDAAAKLTALIPSGDTKHFLWHLFNAFDS